MLANAAIVVDRDCPDVRVTAVEYPSSFSLSKPIRAWVPSQNGLFRSPATAQGHPRASVDGLTARVIETRHIRDRYGPLSSGSIMGIRTASSA
jgi:hypothetical protein